MRVAASRDAYDYGRLSWLQQSHYSIIIRSKEEAHPLYHQRVSCRMSLCSFFIGVPRI